MAIRISELRQSDIGKWIIYTNGVGQTERGKLKSWNRKNVFVVFKCGDEWDRFQDFTGSSCNPKTLDFEKRYATLKDWLTIK